MLGILPQAGPQQMGMRQAPIAKTGVPPIFHPSLDTGGEDIMEDIARSIDPVSSEIEGGHALNLDAFESTSGIPGSAVTRAIAAQTPKVSPVPKASEGAVSTIPVSPKPPATAASPQAVDAVAEASTPGTSRPIDQQSGLEYGANVFGNVVDDVVDEFGNLVNEGVNIGDRFVNRPGSEQASRIERRDADIQAWNDKYSGNIGTELLDAIQARGGWGSALGGMTDEVKNFLIDLFDPRRGEGTTDVAPAPLAPQDDWGSYAGELETAGSRVAGAPQPPQQTSYTSPLIPKGITSIGGRAGEGGETGIDAIISSLGLLDMDDDMEILRAMGSLPLSIKKQIIARIEEMEESANVGITDVAPKEPDQFTDFGR